MSDDAIFCATCGKKIGGEPTSQVPSGLYPSSHVKPQQYDSMVSSPVATTSTKHAVWWGAGILGVLIVAGLVTFFATQVTKPTPQSDPQPQIIKKNETKDPTPAQPSQVVTGVMPNSTMNINVLADFRIYVQAKERLNTEIIALASQINSRLNNSGTLRYSHDLRNRARLLINDSTQYSSNLAGKNYPLEFQGAKSLLLQLFDLETTRARSLYNGLIEGINDQDYQSSFSVGTRAAYEFDEMNARFIQEYSSLDR